MQLLQFWCFVLFCFSGCGDAPDDPGWHGVSLSAGRTGNTLISGAIARAHVRQLKVMQSLV